MGSSSSGSLHLERVLDRPAKGYNAPHLDSDVLACVENEEGRVDKVGVKDASISSSDCKRYLCSSERTRENLRRIWFLVLAGISSICMVALSDFHSRYLVNNLFGQDTGPTSKVDKELSARVAVEAPIRDYLSKEEETYVERLVSRYGIGIVIVLFFGFMLWTTQRQLLPLYIKRREKELELMDKQKEVLTTVASAQVAAANALNKIGDRVDQVMDATKSANGKLERVDEKLDDCIEEHKKAR